MERKINMKYERPEMEVLEFKEEDVIRTSSTTGETSGDGNDNPVIAPDEW